MPLHSLIIINRTVIISIRKVTHIILDPIRMLDIPQLDTRYLELTLISLVQNLSHLSRGQPVGSHQEVHKRLLLVGLEGAAVVLTDA